MALPWVSRAWFAAAAFAAAACTGDSTDDAKGSPRALPLTWECLKAQPNLTQSSPAWFARDQIQRAIDTGDHGPKTVEYYREMLAALRGTSPNGLAAPALQNVPCTLREGEQ